MDGSDTAAPQTVHVSILSQPITDRLLEPYAHLPSENWRHVDCTLGGAGHLEAFLKAFQAKYGDEGLQKLKWNAFDRDPDAIARARIRLKSFLPENGQDPFLHAPFSTIAKHFPAASISSLLADFGLSSDQLDSRTRGFGFQTDSPLDMRMDPNSDEPTALEILNSYSEEDLARILWDYGEERLSRKIARAIVTDRSKGTLPKTTTPFSELIRRLYPPKLRHQRPHPATRTFQALRIEVNQELKEIDSLLTELPRLTQKGGRIACISFHSLEDRKVKHTFRNKDDWSALTSKPILPDDDEIAQNPRARSAKLRLADKT
jgi:16S rRNA (cytosine1402-N4)-methyltransferase